VGGRLKKIHSLCEKALSHQKVAKYLALGEGRARLRFFLVYSADAIYLDPAAEGVSAYKEIVNVVGDTPVEGELCEV